MPTATQTICERCQVGFAPGEWFCADGTRHTVGLKTYLLNDPPMLCGRDERGNPLPIQGRTILTNIPPPPDLREIGWQCGADDEGLGGSVIFENGRFETTDPEQQFWLDERGGFCTEAQWEAAWLSPEAQRRLEFARGEAECKNLETQIEQLKNSKKQAR